MTQFHPYSVKKKMHIEWIQDIGDTAHVPATFIALQSYTLTKHPNLTEFWTSTLDLTL